MLWIVIVIVLVLVMLGSFPGVSPYHHSYGYFPSGLFGLILLVLLLYFLFGR
jgi:hypothetical protein